MRRNKPSLALGLIVAGGFMTGAAIPAYSNIAIVPTFDTSITSDANAAAIEAGINSAISQVESNLLNPITVNITFSELSTGLAQSTWLTNTISYPQYLSDLKTKQTPSASDNTALASLPNSNPLTTGGVKLTLPLLRALGEASGANSGADGTVGLRTSIMNLSRTGVQNPNFYDLQAIALHNIDDVLGIGAPGSTLGLSGTDIGDEDLFRYQAPGVRSYSVNASIAYFSIDGGVTNISNFVLSSAGDYADWQKGTQPQVQDSVPPLNHPLNLGPSELTALDVVGYDLVPEPSACGLVSLAALGLLNRRHRGRLARIFHPICK